ncbi:MAG: outer membrane beta-barrel protein [Methyloligellaceae bacterium]
MSDIDNEGFVEAEQSGFTAGERLEPETSELQPRDSDLRWGIFAVQPELILRSTFSDNIHQDHSKKPDFSTGLEGRIQATTDTSRHELAIDVAFLKTAFHSSNKKETMDYSTRVDGRLDITSRQAIEGGLALTRENGSGSRIRREDILETAAHIGLRQRFNRLTISLRGEVLDHEDQNSSSNDYQEIGGRLTGNYELRSGYALGIETNFHRRNDKIVPGSGGNRSRAKFTSILAGIDIVNEKPVQGSFRAGYGWSEDTDPSAGKLEGIVVEGNLTWRPTRLTMLQLAGSTEISGTSDPSNGTSMDYLLTLNLDHALTRHFLLSANVESEFNRYRDTGNMDRTLTYTLAGEYELNRRLAIVGTASHKTFNSIDGLGDYRENQLSLAMRVKQ